MLIGVEGIYRNGRIEIAEQPADIPEGTRAIVTFIPSNEIDLRDRGIDKEQAQLLRASLATFADDWESPEMDIYDDYDAARAKL